MCTSLSLSLALPKILIMIIIIVIIRRKVFGNTLALLHELHISHSHNEWYFLFFLLRGEILLV